MQNQDNSDLEALDKKIDVIHKDVLEIIESTNLTVEAKKNIIEFKSQQIKDLLDRKTEAGWTDIRGKNLIILGLESLKEGLDTGHERKLYEVAKRQQSEEKGLIDAIPKDDKRLRPAKKMVRLFEKSSEVPNYLLARCIIPTVRINSARRKLGSKDYESNQPYYNAKIKNCLRALNKYLEFKGIRVGFRSRKSVLINTSIPDFRN